MTKDRHKYFEEIGMSPVARGRAEEMISLMAGLFDVPIKDVFISDRFDEKGIRSHESLFAITEEYLLESQNFMTNTRVDLALISNVEYIEADFVEFKPGISSDGSRLNITLQLPPAYFSLFAARNNCQYLFEIARSLVPYAEKGHSRGVA